MYNICVTLTTDNTTTAGINYKELHHCKYSLAKSRDVNGQENT